MTSEVLYRLKLGEKVCYIGEREGFAILDWREFSVDRTAENQQEELAYARLADLWPPKDLKSSTSGAAPGVIGLVFSKAKEYFRRLRYGQPPSDALEPIRPAIDLLEERVEPSDTE